MVPLIDVAYVTHDGALADADSEVELAVEALRRQGLTCQVVCWDDASVDWAGFRLVLVRSPWDYVARHGEFLDWARAVDKVAVLRNPLPVLERNTVKTYLRDLEAVGIPIVPTAWVDPGDVLTALPWADATGPIDVVVKPAVSAGARDTWRTAEFAVAAAHVQSIVETGRVAMVQPYVSAVEGEGEVSVVLLGGQMSHAVRRQPMLVPGAGHAFDNTNVRTPDADQVALAERVLAATPERDDLLYARIDMVRDADGELMLMEAELTEPSLFLEYVDGAADRLAAAVAAAVVTGRSSA